MATDLPLLVEEEYIEIDTSSNSAAAAFLCYTVSSPSHPLEFEFHMSDKTLAVVPLTSPADDLFHNGKLLPLHPPQNLQPPFNTDSTTTTSTYNTSTATNTPFESCTISPATSCYVSGELNPEDYCYDCPEEIINSINSNPKKSWSKKLKSIGQSSLSLKLKASKAYIKSMFTKIRCSDESSAAAPKGKESSKGFMKVGRSKNPFRMRIHVEAHTIDRVKMTEEEEAAAAEEEDCGHRRSFSRGIKWHSFSKTSSASTSTSSSSCSSSDSSAFSGNGPQTLKRSSSVNSEVEGSIYGAIAYCKKSQQMVCARKSASDVGLSSLSACKIAEACEKQRGLDCADDSLKSTKEMCYLSV